MSLRPDLEESGKGRSVLRRGKGPVVVETMKKRLCSCGEDPCRCAARTDDEVEAGPEDEEE